MFGELASIDGMQVGGIVNAQPDLHAAQLRKGLAGRNGRGDERALIDEIDRVVARRKLPKSLRQKAVSRLQKSRISRLLSGPEDRQKPDPLVSLDPARYGDFLWSRLFAPTLPASYKSKVLSGQFFAVRTGRRSANRMALASTAPAEIDTSGWDLLIANTPFPYAISAGTKLIVRYYDAIPVLFPDTVSEGEEEAERHRTLLHKNAHSGAWFSCISAPVRDDLLRLAPEAGGRAFVIPCMASPLFWPEKRPDAEIQQIVDLRGCPASELEPGGSGGQGERQQPTKRLSPGFFMAVSTLEPRKNFHLLIKAWADLRGHLGDDVPDLVLIANPGWRFAQAAAAINHWRGRGLFHLWRVPMEELRALYSAAMAVVCPSITEGFNLSGVEAMRCKTAVIASDIAVHRSVYGDAARYFDPAEPTSLVRVLSEAACWPADEGQGATLRAHGLQQSAQYRPETVARTWREFLRRVRSD